MENEDPEILKKERGKRTEFTPEEQKILESLGPATQNLSDEDKRNVLKGIEKMQAEMNPDIKVWQEWAKTNNPDALKAWEKAMKEGKTITPREADFLGQIPEEEQAGVLDELSEAAKTMASKETKLDLLKDSTIREIVFTRDGKLEKLVVVKDCIAYDLTLSAKGHLIMDGVEI